jgi:D-alanyl-D-alanine carboxypeptidase
LVANIPAKHNRGGNLRQHLCVCLSKWGKSHPIATPIRSRFETKGLSIVPFLQKLLLVPASALALTAAAEPGLTMLDVRPARADALLLVDVDTGKVINEQNSTYPWYPASVTKLMTTYVTLKALRDRRIDLESLLTVSPNAVAQQPSKMGFKLGTRLTVDNALKMLLVHSANDMAVVLAEGVSGSIEKFTGEMNAEARRLGMTQTNYVNPNGLPADEQITSARDLAILARALILDFPEYDYFWHIASIRLGKRIYRNTNKLIDAYAGTDGMKTGFICASGFNLVATATRGGKRLIAVVLGAKSSASRAVKAAQLFERGFGTDPLSWLVPSQGTVESLQPVDATPLDMHEEVCSNNRRRQPTEDGEEGGEAGTAPAEATNGEMPIVSPWSLRGVALLTSGLAAGIPPVEVYTGPVRNGAPGAAPAAAPVPKRKPLAVAAKPLGAKPAPVDDLAAKPAAHPKPTTAASVTKPSPGKPSPGSEKAAAATAGAKARPAAKQPLQITPKTDAQ